MKCLRKSCQSLTGGLQEVAEQGGLDQTGPQTSGGSDPLLPGMAFFKMREVFFEDGVYVVDGIVVICEALGLIHPTYRTAQGMHMKKKPTSCRDVK